ncbi:unnamed protein product [Cunninghamella echinulata]
MKYYNYHCNKKKTLGNQIEKFDITAPRVFDGRFVDVINKGGYARGVDWLWFFLYILPTLVVGIFRPAHTEVKNALLVISKVCAFALQFEAILGDELVEIERCVKVWYRFLYKYYKDTAFVMSQHYLTHLVPAIKTLRPLRLISCSPMERWIGVNKSKTNSRLNPRANTENLISKLISEKFISLQGDVDGDHADTTIDDSPLPIVCELEDGNKIQLFEPKPSSLEEMEANLREIKGSEEVDIKMLLENFYKGKHDSLRQVVSNNDVFIGKEIIHCGNIYGGLKKNSKKQHPEDFVILSFPTFKHLRIRIDIIKDVYVDEDNVVKGPNPSTKNKKLLIVDASWLDSSTVYIERSNSVDNIQGSRSWYYIYPGMTRHIFDLRSYSEL